MNSADVLFDDTMLSALINSCSFIYISEGDEDIPRMQVIPGSEATGILDPITRMLTEGYAVLSRDERVTRLKNCILSQAELIIISTAISVVCTKQRTISFVSTIIHRPDASRPLVVPESPKEQCTGNDTQ